MTFLEKLNTIERLHQLIRLRATGNPKTLADKFGISRRAIFDIINILKQMGAPVEYCIYKQSYCYVQECDFKIGFFGGNVLREEQYNNQVL